MYICWPGSKACHTISVQPTELGFSLLPSLGVGIGWNLQLRNCIFSVGAGFGKIAKIIPELWVSTHFGP